MADSDDVALRKEFHEVYRRPGARYLGTACAFAGFAACAFYLIDAIGNGQPYVGGPQTLRLVLTIGYLALAAFCLTQVEAVTRYYPS